MAIKIFLLLLKVELNSELNDLNNNLDSIKIDNVKLKDDINHIRREIDCLRGTSLNSKRIRQQQQTTTTSLIYEYGDESMETSLEFLFREDMTTRQEDVDEEEDDEWKWMREELAAAREATARDYAEFTSEQLCAYESELERELMDELERLEGEYWSREDTLGRESDALLDELVELNAQLGDDLAEFEEQTRINAQLNARLIQLSSSLIEFNSMSKETQERMVINYSIVCLNKENGDLDFFLILIF